MKSSFISVVDVGKRSEIAEVIAFIVYFDLIAMAINDVFHYYFDSFWMNKLTRSISNFTTTVLILEIAIYFSWQGKAFAFHPRCCIDVILLGKILYDDVLTVTGCSTSLRLLFGLMRLSWRLMLLVGGKLSRVEERHNCTKDNLMASKKMIEKMRFEAKQLKEIKNRETSLRKQVEKMLSQYKSELEMMKEALHIAAMDRVSHSMDKKDTNMNNDAMYAKRENDENVLHICQDNRISVGEDGSFEVR